MFLGLQGLNIQCMVGTLLGTCDEQNSESSYYDAPGDSSDPQNNVNIKSPLYAPFQLPITYIPNDQVFPLSETVRSDLELVVSKSEKSMYQHLFQPSHPFADKMIDEWKKQYTTNVDYLRDTQQVIQECGHLRNTVSNHKFKLKHEMMMEIWKDVKEDAFFLEKYCYVEWDMLKQFNKSSTFLQILSMANVMSPIISLLIPILFLIFPFFLLKIQGIPITVSIYIDVLKDIAKNHFIGKTLLSMENISWEKVIYTAATFGLYLYQIYQNIMMCSRFYKNTHKINESLCEMRDYLGYSIRNMETFMEMHKNKPTYSAFCKDMSSHCETLKQFQEELQPIMPFDRNIIFKMSEVGYLLKCYYELHSNLEYEKSIRYSFGFEGYIDNLFGVYKHIESHYISFAEFDLDQDCKLKDQYYPPYFDQKHVKNDCSLKKNMIITGPNASGKTTMLKSTTINIIFTQQMGCGFYSKCTINPYTHIHSYLNIPDTSERDSLFQAESRRCKEIIDVINNNPQESGNRHFCIFDELYSGTNPVEATKAAYSFLQYLTKFKHVDFILTTHYVSICTKWKKSKHICNYKMEVENDEDGKMQYTYKMKKGISKIQGAVRILEDMQYPSEIIDSMKKCKI